MITKKLFHTINEVQMIQELAERCPSEVALHSLDNASMIDAKSYIGFYALNFREPVLVVCEDASFHKRIATVGTTLR